MRVERLSGDLFEPAVELWRVSVQPGHGSEGTFAFDGEIVAVCEEGVLTCTIADEEYVLQPGDSLHFKAAIPHAWHNHGDVTARFLVACDSARKFHAALHRRLATGTRRSE